jgi:hypothetical protein
MTKEEFLRSFLSRQRDISKQALIATATMAQMNMEMILTSGLPKVWPKILNEVREDVNIQGQLDEIKEGIKANQQNIEEIKLAQSFMSNTANNVV